MITDVKAQVAQVSPVITDEGDTGYTKMTKLGAMFVSDWKMQLMLAGLVWHAEVGTVTVSADVAPVTGGGNGTTIDSDQPELVVGVDAGYYLIPIECRCGVHGDVDADTEEMNIVLFADRTQAPVTANASGTLYTPINMLDGANSAFPGRCWVASTGDVTDPVTSQILDYVSHQAAAASAAGVNPVPVTHMAYSPSTPPILAGPCQVVLCWGGTAAVTGIANLTFALVPTSYFPLS